MSDDCLFCKVVGGRGPRRRRAADGDTVSPSVTSTRRRRPTSWWCRARTTPTWPRWPPPTRPRWRELVLGRPAGRDRRGLTTATGWCSTPARGPARRCSTCTRTCSPEGDSAGRPGEPAAAGRDRRRGCDRDRSRPSRPSGARPALAAGVVRDGQPAWRGLRRAPPTPPAVGPPPTADTQYRMGSITKTFTAVLVMQCRDEGLLDLDDQLGSTCPAPGTGALTVRRMLAHLSGLQREPVGEVWERPRGRSCGAARRARAAEAVLPPGRPRHYSNLAFALLGEVVGRLRGQPWEQVLAARCSRRWACTGPRRAGPSRTPAGTSSTRTRTGCRPSRCSPATRSRPAAELWSTVADLARWAAFIADPDADVLAPETRRGDVPPAGHARPGQLAAGLGAGLHAASPRRPGAGRARRRDARVPGRSGGPPPGEGRRGRVREHLGRCRRPGELAIDLVLRWSTTTRSSRSRGGSGLPCPPSSSRCSGRGGRRAASSCSRPGTASSRHGAATCPRPRAPVTRRAGRADEFRSVSGREHGELLRVVRRRRRARSGELYWATYPFTRDPQTFGA